MLQLKYNEKNQPPTKSTNRCSKNEIDSDKLREERESKRLKERDKTCEWCVRMCRNIIINSYLMTATFFATVSVSHRGGSVPGHGRVFARASTLVHN